MDWGGGRWRELLSQSAIKYDITTVSAAMATTCLSHLTLAIMTVWQFPPNESFNSLVSLLSR